MCCIMPFPTRTEFAQGERTRYIFAAAWGTAIWHDVNKRESCLCHVVPQFHTVTDGGITVRQAVEHILLSFLLARVNNYAITRVSESLQAFCIHYLRFNSRHTKNKARREMDAGVLRLAHPVCVYVNKMALFFARCPRTSTKTSTAILTALYTTTTTGI